MDNERIEAAAARRARVGRTLTYLFLVIWALIVLFPFYWMVLSSIKSYGAYNSEYIPQYSQVSPDMGAPQNGQNRFALFGTGASAA